MGKSSMHLWRLSRFLIVVLAVAGLVSAPLAMPALAKSAPSVVASTVDMQGVEMQGEMQGMAADMPCCPDQKPSNDCVCPLLALCMLTVSPAAPSGYGWLAPRQLSHSAFAYPDDLMIDGLGEHPPEHPPRSII
jgi:hypothetical protein